MELRDMVVGKVYRVDAGTWGGLCEYRGRCGAGDDLAMMHDMREPNPHQGNFRILPHQVRREATDADLECLRVEPKLDKGKETEQARVERETETQTFARTKTQLIVERIKAATTVVMHLTHMQENHTELKDSLLDVLEAAQAFLLREFEEDKPMQEERG